MPWDNRQTRAHLGDALGKPPYKPEPTWVMPWDNPFAKQSPWQEKCQRQEQGHSLWVHLVEGAIHAHGGAQAAHALVVPQLVEDGTQRGGHQVGRAEGHDGADVLHSDAVLVGRLHAQPGQDLFGFVQTFFAPAKQRGTPQWAVGLKNVQTCVALPAWGLRKLERTFLRDLD